LPCYILLSVSSTESFSHEAYSIVFVSLHPQPTKSPTPPPTPVPTMPPTPPTPPPTPAPTMPPTPPPTPSPTPVVSCHVISCSLSRRQNRFLTKLTPLFSFLSIHSRPKKQREGTFFKNKLTRFRNCVLEYKIIHIKYNPTQPKPCLP
jgi:hypothetical protein